MSQGHSVEIHRVLVRGLDIDQPARARSLQDHLGARRLISRERNALAGQPVRDPDLALQRNKMRVAVVRRSEGTDKMQKNLLILLPVGQADFKTVPRVQGQVLALVVQALEGDAAAGHQGIALVADFHMESKGVTERCFQPDMGVRAGAHLHQLGLEARQLDILRGLARRRDQNA